MEREHHPRSEPSARKRAVLIKIRLIKLIKLTRVICTFGTEDISPEETNMNNSVEAQ